MRSSLANSQLGSAKATHGLYEDPSLFAGVRPYQAGDPMRRIHWKATARLGVPMSRRYDPAREPDVLIAVDMQTRPGDWWLLNWDDDLVEGLCVAALSFARSFIGDGIAVGLAINAYSDRPQRTVYLPPSAAAGQIAEMADRLADVSPFASVPFERLLADVARRAPLGCSILALSGRDPVGFLPTLRRIRAQGYLATLAAFGPDGRPVERACARAGRAECRIPARSRLADGRCARTRRLRPPSPCWRPPCWRLPGSRLVYVTAEHLAGGGTPPLSLFAFAGAALIGVGFARASGPAGRPAYRTMLAAVAVAVAVLGWLLPLGPAAAQVVDEPASVFGMHPAGILLGLAVLRGIRTHDRSRRRTDRGNRARTGPGGHRRPLGAPDGDRRDGSSQGSSAPRRGRR